MKLSGIILTKNEEKNIEDCIKSLSFCDEVIVVDDNSQDKTGAVAENLGVKVFSRSLSGDFASQRNFGLAKAKGEWVIFVDADERVPSALAAEIYNLQFTIYKGFYIKRRDYMWGRELHYGEVGNVKLLRLARKDAGRWKRKVHEYWDVKGKVGELKNPILHFPHQTLHEFFDHVDFYSTLHAQQKFEDGERSNLLKIILWPKFKFIKNFILLGGFMDGDFGFVHAMIMSFHSFLAWSKLWLLGKK